MTSRLELQKKFEEILESRNVYFQPPESIKISYPAIVYRKSNIENIYANDSTYLVKDSYEITYISENPDDTVPYSIMNLPYCSFVRRYTSDNLYHDVFTLIIRR